MTDQRTLLFAFMASIPFTDVSRAFLGGVSAVEILLVILGSMLIVRTMRGGAVLLTPGVVLALGLSLLAVLAYLWASIQAPVIPIQTSFWVEYGLIYLMVLQFAREPDLRNAALLGLLAGAALAGAFGLLHWGLGPGWVVFHRWGPEWAGAESRTNFRVYGSFNNPLNLAGYFAVVAGASTYVLSSTRSRLVLAGAGAFFALSAIALVVTGSKIVLAVLFVCGTFLLVRRPSVAPVFVAAALVVVLSGTADTLLNRISDNPLESTSVVQRTYLLSSFTHMIADRPILGFGVGNFKESYFQSYMHPSASSDPRVFTSENMVLEVAVQMGVVGALVLLVLIFRSLLAGMVPSASVSFMGRSVAIAPVVSLAVIGYIVVGMIQSMASPSLNYLLFSLLALQDAATTPAAEKTILQESPNARLAGSEQA